LLREVSSRLRQPSSDFANLARSLHELASSLHHLASIKSKKFTNSSQKSFCPASCSD
jgi:hypothetical protein